MTDTITSLAESSDRHLLCRELGHAWEPVTDTGITTGVRDEIIEFTRQVKCVRCNAWRRQVISVPDFTVRSSSIAYPDGYLIDGARPRKAAVRQETLHRLTTQL